MDFQRGDGNQDVLWHRYRCWANGSCSDSSERRQCFSSYIRVFRGPIGLVKHEVSEVVLHILPTRSLLLRHCIHAILRTLTRLPHSHSLLFHCSSPSCSSQPRQPPSHGHPLTQFLQSAFDTHRPYLTFINRYDVLSLFQTMQDKSSEMVATVNSQFAPGCRRVQGFLHAGKRLRHVRQRFVHGFGHDIREDLNTRPSSTRYLNSVHGNSALGALGKSRLYMVHLRRFLRLSIGYSAHT